MSALLGVPVQAAAADTTALAQNLDSITFTNEMWDPNMLQLLGEEPEIIPPLNRFDGLLPPPPTNSSVETRAEAVLDALLNAPAFTARLEAAREEFRTLPLQSTD